MRRALKRWVRSVPALQRLASAAQRDPRVVGAAPYRWVYRRWIDRRRRDLALPDQLDVEVTNACNARCVMCPHPTMERPTGVMARALFERLVVLAAREGVRTLNLNNIGEPLLDPHLAWRVRLAKKAGLAVSLHTNAQLLDARRARELVDAGIDHVGVSLDGASAATYQDIRLGLDFTRVVGNLEGLLALRRDGRPYVSVTLVRQEQNAGDVAALRARFGGRADDVVIRDARDWAGAVTFARPPSAAEARSRDLLDDLPRFPCKLLWARMVVLHDGRVALCSIDHEARHVVGDLRTEGIADVWNGPAMTEVRRSHLDGRFDGAAICGRCRVRESWW